MSDVPTYPKRLIEVDLPIKRISAHARREKSIRHGHISTLHIWWARRPLAACRAVICASLWPDPADPLCPQSFRDSSAAVLSKFAASVYNKASLHTSASVESFGQWEGIVQAAKEGLAFDTSDPVHLSKLRFALLDFIADFANWDNSKVVEYLEASRALTQAAHESLGGDPGSRPLVVDPFAGGGSIPIEALRVGADTFASDLNPIPVLLNKVVLEYIPKYGQRLADEVRKWGTWIKSEVEKELAEFYPNDLDGSTPIAYLWARTILSEAPDEGDIPVEVPLMRSLWLSKKTGQRRALRWVRNNMGRVKTETVKIVYVEDGQRVLKNVNRPLLEIFEPVKESDVEGGTVARGSATCPVTGFTTKVDRVRAQIKSRRGAAGDARLFCVVTTRKSEKGRFYRLPMKADHEAFNAAEVELERREKADGTQRSQKGRRDGESIEAVRGNQRSLVPDEQLDVRGIRHTWSMIYGLERWGDFFSPRQSLVLTTLSRLVRDAGERMSRENAIGGRTIDRGMVKAVQTCLALAVTKHADANCANCAWRPTSLDIGHLFGRQAIGMVWDFAEVNPTSGSTRDFWNGIEGVLKALDSTDDDFTIVGQVEQSSATSLPLPDDAAAAFVTDPPYYDAVPYAYLSDFFYVWMRRMLAEVHPSLFREAGVPKDDEIVVDRPHQLSQSTKDIRFYEHELTKAFAEGRRVLAPSGIGTIVFASKTTASWEAILKAVIDAGFIITGSWPIDTEMETRVAAQGQARLASSVHLVCRPRDHPDGTVRTGEIGDWRDVLQELPCRIHEWMPRLAEEGVVGADAIFACLGPALEVFSRYSHVEKASGAPVTLREYLEQVWAAVSKEALGMIFRDADATGLEEDARLTAIWFWVLKAARNGENGPDNAEEEFAQEEDEVEDQTSSTTNTKHGFSLEFDAARKLAQGLGVDLYQLSRPGGVLKVTGNISLLFRVSQREEFLFGQQLSLFDDIPPQQIKSKKPKDPTLKIKSVPERQQRLFDEDPRPPHDPDRPLIPGLRFPSDDRSSLERLKDRGRTTLDRLHQAMLLFGRSQVALMGPFLIDTGMANNDQFWMLAQSLSALYPPGTEEKRWVDGVLARKKGLGF